jgi:hypothetical protein
VTDIISNGEGPEWWSLLAWMTQSQSRTARIARGSRYHTGYLTAQQTLRTNGDTRTTIYVRDSRRGPRSQYALVTDLDRLQIKVAGRDRVICDFCSAPDPVRSYPCRNFDMGTPSVTSPIPATNASDGAWAACAHCSALIDATNREGLAQRSAQYHLDHNPDLKRVCASQARPLLLAGIRELFDDFWRHREGPGVPLDPAEAAAEHEPDYITFSDTPPRRAAWLDLL